MSTEIDIEDTKIIIKHMLKTLTEKCDEEALNNSSTIPYINKIARIKYYTGLSQDLIEKLVNDQPGRTKLSLASRILILNTLKGLYEQSQLPTYNIILEETRNELKNEYDQPITHYNEFVEEMERLGYMLKETVNNSMIVIEDPEVRFERFMYLHKLKKFRSDSVRWPQIVYIDERIVNLTEKYEKPMLSDSQKLSLGEEESIFYHAVSKTGFLTGMFSNQHDFNKWVTDILLSHLKSSSVIILDTLHGPPQNVSSITKHHSKTAMLLWLTNNNIPCSSNMSKPALYELIARCNENQKEHHIDRILRSQGHEVLRLPRHLYDLSITTALWNTLERQEIEMTTSLMDKQNELLKKITALPEATWLGYESELEKVEADIYDIDKTMENFCDMYEFKL